MKRVVIFFELLLVLIVLVLIGFGAWITYLNTRVDTVENQDIKDVPGQIITVDGYELHVQIFGDINNGTPILMLHQFDPMGGLSLRDFAMELGESRPVILPDLLGFGFSERVTESGEHYTYAGQSALLGSMLDNLGVNQVDVIGHAYGGAIAVQFSLDNPDRVQHLVLISADIYEGEFNLIAEARTLPGGIGRAFSFITMGGGSVERLTDATDCVNCQTDIRSEYATLMDTTDAIMAIYNSEVESQLAENFDALTMPVAVIWGNTDNVIDLDYGLRLMEEIDADETAIIIDGGHYPFEVEMDEVRETIEQFLSG